MMIRITSFHRASLVNILAYLLMITQIDSEDFGGQVYTDTTLALTNSPYVVKKDIIVPENATLNIEPGVKMYILPGIALQINGSLQAKGNATHRIVLTKMSNNSMGNTRTIGNEGIRLADGGSYKVGRLEIFVHGKWGTVCNEWFDEKDAQVACRQLGFMKAKRYYTHGGGKGQIWLSHLQCSGQEKSLLNCKRSGSFCFGYDVGVECDNFAWHTFFWSGIMFKNSKISSTLQHLDISDAYKAISGDEYLPELDHVTVTHSAFGVISINLKSPLILIDSAVRNNTYAGVQITGKSKNIQITNTTIGHTIRADGFSQ
ncbi:protein bark beetle-like [Dendronephthya gigantea]|uniref:protein bark beetle-like n=1 Tax=Dendronephthya gigantea TaxID=151771 RepID=UPI0010694148|nr:protein bark beetle-like [Dendronephthya gigantea]